MEEMILYYGGASVAVGLIMEILVKIDSVIDSWDLSGSFVFFGFTVTWLQVIGLIVSTVSSVVLTYSGGLYWAYAIAGAIAIYFMEFGAGKLGWRKVFEVVYNIAKALAGK